MHCPFCRHPDSRVVDSREADEGQAIRRRRSCPECGRRFTTVETAVLDFVREADNDLAQKIMDNMFTFDDLVNLDDKGIQSLMKEVQSESLVIALKGASPELRERILKNMSTRAAETLREDLETRGPVRLSEVEAEQKEMLKIVRRLADEGQIVLGGGGDEQFV